jgi:hypothetical protein
MPAMSLLTAWRAYRGRKGLARESITLALGLVAGIVLLPAAVYVAGRATLGAYTRSPTDPTPGGPLAFMGDFLAGLAAGSLAHWLLALGPYVLYLIVRFGRRARRA